MYNFYNSFKIKLLTLIPYSNALVHIRVDFSHMWMKSQFLAILLDNIVMSLIVEIDMVMHIRS